MLQILNGPGFDNDSFQTRIRHTIPRSYRHLRGKTREACCHPRKELEAECACHPLHGRLQTGSIISQSSNRHHDAPLPVGQCQLPNGRKHDHPKAVDGIELAGPTKPALDKDEVPCIACALGKSHKMPFHSSERFVKNPGDLLVFDLVGPISPPTAKGIIWIESTLRQRPNSHGYSRARPRSKNGLWTFSPNGSANPKSLSNA
jgi:hypothetical protein